MPKRTQIVCLCEGEESSIDAVFINSFFKALSPRWLRRQDSNVVRIIPCGNRPQVVERMPGELRACIQDGADTTLVVWADCDHDCSDGAQLRRLFENEACSRSIEKKDLDRVVFVFAKDRLENWIEFIESGATDESLEGPRVKHSKTAALAGSKLGHMCKGGEAIANMPSSMRWSCQNWQALVDRMKEK